jgi:putative DNA primase/helicase
MIIQPGRQWRQSIEAEALIKALGAKRSGSGWIGRCPAHEDRSPSLSISIGSGGRLLMHCHAGCSYQDVLRVLGVSAGTQITYIQPAEPVQTASNEQQRKHRQQAIEQVWRESLPIEAGDPVDCYLRNRGINLEAYPAVLRHHRALPYFEDSTVTGTHPTMLARVDSPDGELVTLHRTFLTPEGRKAPVPTPKRLMPCPISGGTRGGAIRLFPTERVLGVAEGIETALSCYRGTGLPVWSTVSAGGMERLELPAGIIELVIFADHDRSARGQQAAQTLARRAIAAGITTKILTPSVPGTDWADTISKESP